MLKSIKDYLPDLIAQFPTVPPSDVKRAIEYGWRMLYYYNLRGCDTLISSSKFKYWFYCGQLTRDSIKHFNYYKRMLRRKLRVLYVKKAKEWDGYYYIGLTDDEYKTVVESNSGRGRKKKNFIFHNKNGIKIFDEAKVYYSWSKYIVRYRYITDMGYTFFKDTMKCKDLEIILVRDKPSTFKDILITSNNYELIKHEKGNN